MAKIIRQLQREVNRAKAQHHQIMQRKNLLEQHKRLTRELYLLKHPGLQRTGNLLYRGAQRAGKGILNQGRLIKEQQERENREYKQLYGKKKKR